MRIFVLDGIGPGTIGVGGTVGAIGVANVKQVEEDTSAPDHLHDQYALKTVVDTKATKTGDTIVVANHGTAATPQVVNVCYGTSTTPPSAGNATEGTLYIKYIP